MTTVAKVFVRGLTVEAEIGVWTEEVGRRQSLIIDVEMEIAPSSWRKLTDTVNYERVVAHALAIANSGHIGLVEAFAQRLADACLAESGVQNVRVRVEKPGALVPHALTAGVEIVQSR